MTTIPVLWVSYRPEILARGYADQGFLEAALAGELWTPPFAYEFEHHEWHIRDSSSMLPYPDFEGCVFIFNGRTHVEYVEFINRFINRFKWVMVLLCGDEEWDFPWRDLKHPNMRLYVMQARPEHAELERFIPGGWYPRTRELLDKPYNAKSPRDLDWSFAGQITHERRQEAAAVLRGLPAGLIIETERYLEEKLSRSDYFDLMANSKVVPSPSGPYSVDCARTFEALEAGCIPVVDTKTAYAGAFDYWALLFWQMLDVDESVPFPLVSDWRTFPRVLRSLLKRWPANANQVYAFWQQYKRRFVTQLHQDITDLRRSVRPGNESDWTAEPADLITVVVTASPIPSHPSTEIIEVTIDSIRHQLPTAQIVVACDGVRTEQAEQAADYHEFVRRLTWLTNFRWHNVVPVVMDSFQHQANMTIRAMEHVHTPLMLYVEHDTPLCGEIQWDRLCGAIQSGNANVVQLHINDQLHPDHRGICLDSEPHRINGAWLRRTMAWWQRPHLANANWYRDAILSRFTPKSRIMIEDAVYPVMEGQIKADSNAWNFWKVWFYEPDTPSIKRSLHLNGRKEQPKFDMVWP